MSRTVPPRLLAHLQSGFTTTCRLLRILLADGRTFGLCSLDVPVTYMGTRYSSLHGFDSSVIATDLGVSVDNGEASALLDQYQGGITEAMVLAGDLDDARWDLLLVNYADLTMGHILLDAGDIGEIKVKNGILYTPEILSFAMRLKQNIGTVWSRRCRADFGASPVGQRGCGVDAEALWVDSVVTYVDPNDSRRVFAAFDLIGGQDFDFGRVRWLTGANSSRNRLWQVEAFSPVSATTVMLEPSYYPIQVGDTFRIRRDCNKTPSACVSYNNFLNYKGEPYIPTGDGLETMTPGSQVFGGLSGSEIID